MALSTERIRSSIESMLLVTNEPLPLARIVEVLQGEDPETDPDQVKQAADALMAAYADPDRPLARGFRIEDVGGGLQLRTVPENAPYLRRLLSARPQRLTRAALETLAIIAYRQPVTKPEVEAIRGVDVGATLKALLERDMIRIIGKKEEVGRPILYGTTKKFLELFGLKSLTALPTLREYHELDELHQKQVDELYEREKRGPSISDLAAAAEFLVERQHDTDFDDLEQAVSLVDRAGKATEEMLEPKEPKEPDVVTSEPMPAETDSPDERRKR
jgi:segregation and condensation protein B